MTTATGVTQRYWDDVSEGDELPGFELYLSETKMVEQVSGSQDFYAVHHDREFARSGGHPDIFFNTGFTRAALGRLLTDYAGVDGWVRRLQYAMRRMNRPGDTLKVRGKVVKKYIADDGAPVVDIDLGIENQREGVATPATATVMLPKR
jgi:acyl dehydratase